MRDKIAHPGRLGRGRAAHPELLIHFLKSFSRFVVQREISGLRRAAVPEIDIRFVPHFEIPLLHFGFAVAIHQMLRESLYQRTPLAGIFRRGRKRLVPEGMRLRIRGQLARHEAKLNERLHSAIEQPIVDLVNVGNIIDRVDLFVFVVHAVFIVENRVEADVFQIGMIPYQSEVLTIAVPQAQIGAP